MLLGVLGCVTVLPSMILVFDKPLQKTRHRSLIPRMDGLANGIVKFFPVCLVLFAAAVPPALLGYQKTNSEVYYDIFQNGVEPVELAVDLFSGHLVRRVDKQQLPFPAFQQGGYGLRQKLLRHPGTNRRFQRRRTTTSRWSTQCLSSLSSSL